MTVDQTLVAGRYRLVRSLGVGGMGRVWLARDEVLRRDVAVKEIALPFGLADDEREEMRQRTLREARAAARLSHPNVVQIYDVEPGDDRPWIVMEYVRSRSLLQVIKENGPLPVEQVAGIGLAVLSALDAANRVGVLHRDVKPSNVLIADDGRVVLTDFGSAMIDEGEGALTRTGVILGSPQYIAPERVSKGVSSPEADLWSLGATLYDAVEGRPPYTRETTLGTLVALATDKPDPAKLAGPLRPVISGLLQRNPQARMKPAEVAERLRRIADVQTTVHLRRVPAPRRPVSLAEVSGSAAPAAAAADAELRDKAPAVVHPGPPPGERSRAFPLRRQLVRPLAAAVAVLVVLTGLGAAAAADALPWVDSGDKAPAQARTPRMVTAPTPTGVVPSSSPTPVRSPVTLAAAPKTIPAGFHWWDDAAGFRVAVPDGWTQPEGPKVMFFCAPGGPPLLKVKPFGGPTTGVLQTLRRQEETTKLPRYERLSMTESPGRSGAVWEYTFVDPKMGAMRGRDHVVVANDRAYLIQWQVSPAKWRASLADLNIVTRSFEPAAGS